MSTHPFDEDFQDNDPTDELPVLRDVILGEDVESTASMPGSEADADDTGRFRNTLAEARLREDLDARNERLSALEAELGRLQDRWRETEAELSERDTELSRLRAELADREASIAEQRTELESNSDELRAQNATIAELNSSLKLERDRAAEFERSSGDLGQQVEALEQKTKDIEADRAIGRESPTPDAGDATVDRLRDEVAALARHIENRNAVWHDRAETLAAQSIRIRELEIEVAQRIERQVEAERFAEAEAASARAAREKLREALEALKRRDSSQERSSAQQPQAPETASGQRRAAQLKRELAQTVLVQADQGDDAATLSRLAEIEAAIVTLENQMDSEHDEPQIVSPSEPAKLVCLTTAEPTEYPLDKATIMIGRGSSCDVQIGTHYVSREHARITTTDSGCLIEDLGSRNGVFVNAVKVERQDLVTDDLITVGDTQFRYQAGHDE